MSLLKNLLIKLQYKKNLNVLNKISGKPQSVDDYKTRALTCKKIIESGNLDEAKIAAISKIKSECELIADKLEVQLHKDYLSKYSGNDGYDKYIQVAGRAFADELWFYRNRTKISIIKEGTISDYEMYGEKPGLWYKRTVKGITFDISLGKHPFDKVRISIMDREEYDTFLIELEPK